ncbi:MAG TPA: S-layer family protein, partial [Rhizomicrobium sp.]|nr:S-layer family protein [Rhizomicrobium sp.]
DNQVGTADLTATGDASLTDGIDLIVGGANVTGNLTLTGNGTIGQTGAIAAANLTASGTNITLANSNNTISTAYLTASGDALLADGSDLTVGSANVTGTLTLTGAGAIGQSGAILASFLVASGTNITLTNSGNAFGTASITASGDASLYDGSALILAGAHVTGNLALTDASTVGQSGAISAASLTANGTTLTFTDGGNQIGTAYLTATGDATLNDSVALTVGDANVTGNLTLTSAGDIGQSGAIMATILTASGSNLTLANAGNQIGTAYLAATGSASLFDSLGLTIGGANVTGNLTLTGNGSINQSGAIIASSLTAGGINLTFTNSGNKIGTAYLTASGDASLYDGVALIVGGANVTGNLTLTDASGIGQTGAIVAGTLSANGTNITLTNTGNKIGTAYLTASGNAALTDSLALMVGGANITGNLTLTDTGAISQNGSIVASSLMANGTNITLTNGGNRIGKATLTASGDATLTDSVALTVGGANVTGNLTLTDTGSISQTGAIAASVLTANGTSLAFTDAGNKIGAADLTASGNAALYDATSLTLDGAGIGGNLTLLSKGDLDFISSVQLTNGSILAVAGWDGTTATPSANGTYGNHGGSIVIGGSNAAGNVAVGSKNGTTSLLADDIALSAVRGYAQVGYHGGGNGAIVVTAAGDVSLTGGSSTARYAQIGDGGYKVAGSNNAAITVDAAGNVTLSAGSGQEAYAQIGNGGAESNSNSSGYVNTGDITIGGEQVVLDAGSGSGSYAQIGNGGFKSGRSLSGNATIGGDIVVNAVSAVTLTGGATDAYAQIGNAGDYTNSNAADGSGGTTSGEITVSVSSPIDGVDPIILTAGSGAQSYVQIGNGGDFENDPAPGANVSFTVSGNVTINDITIIGSNTGANAYGQIGNGDAAGTGTGDISGDIAVTAGTSFTIVNGTAPGTSAIIANDTGNGTSTGAISGYKSPSNIASDPGTIGTVENTVQNPTTPTDENATIFEPSPNMYYTQTQHIDVETTAELPYPLNELAGGDSENFTPSDDATQRLADSLEHPKIASVQVIVPGLLKQVNDLSAQAIAGVPPADEEYSSWGNQALWTW